MTQTPVLVAIVGILFHLLNGLAAETTSSAVPPLPRIWTSRGKPERSPAVKNAPPAATTKISQTKKTTAISLQTATPTNTVLYGGYLYATLANEVVEGTCGATCQSGVFIDLPAGWSVAPDNADSVAVIAAHTWNTHVLVVDTGNSYGGLCYTKGGFFNANMLSQSGTSYKVNSCSLHVLITNKVASPSPTYKPTPVPTIKPTPVPSPPPTSQPSSRPSNPSGQPSARPTREPFALPTSQPSRQPSTQPSISPSRQPSAQPSLQPFAHPTGQPSRQPSAQPTLQPTCQPSAQPSRCPTAQPSVQPSRQPSSQVSKFPRSFVPPISTPLPTPFFAPPFTPLPTPFFAPPFTLLPLPLSQLSFASIPSSLPTHLRNPSPYPILPYPTLPLSTRTTPLSTFIAHQTAHEAAQHAANAVPHATTHPPAYPSAFEAA
jgi:hypothetical protein